MAQLVSLAILACLEKLSFITNLASAEKDWVVVLIGDNGRRLRLLGSQMRLSAAVKKRKQDLIREEVVDTVD